MNLYLATLYFPLFGSLISLFFKGSLDKYFLVILVISASILIGFKKEGADYYSYLEYFSAIQKSTDLNDVIELIRDPLLYFVVKFLFIFSKSNELIFFFYAFVSLSAIAISLPKAIKHKSLIFCIFVLLYGPGLYYEAIRAGMGLSFYYLSIRYINNRASLIASFMSIASHMSLALPVVAGLRWSRNIITRNLFLTSLLFLFFYKLIPYVLLLNERSLLYLNIEEKGTSLVSIALLGLFLTYILITKKIYVENSRRAALISGALVPFFLSVIFSMYSEITSSRLYEIGCAILFLLYINDCSEPKLKVMNLYASTTRWGVVIVFMSIQIYLWYLRFVVEYIY